MFAKDLRSLGVNNPCSGEHTARKQGQNTDWDSCPLAGQSVCNEKY